MTMLTNSQRDQLVSFIIDLRHPNIEFVLCQCGRNKKIRGAFACRQCGAEYIHKLVKDMGWLW